MKDIVPKLGFDGGNPKISYEGVDSKLVTFGGLLISSLFLPLYVSMMSFEIGFILLLLLVGAGADIWKLSVTTWKRRVKD